MERLSFLGQPNDEREVDALLSQLRDEHLMKLKLNSHSKFSKLSSSVALASDSSSISEKDGDGVLDPELSSRLANLKAGPRKQSSGSSSRRKGKESTESRRRKPSPRGGSGEEEGRFPESTSEQKLNRSSGRGRGRGRERDGDVVDDSGEIDANLMARFLALKTLPSSDSPTAYSVQSSAIIFPSSEEAPSSDYYNSPSDDMSSPSTNLLDGSSSRSSPRVMTNSLATSCHCSTPSPFKLLKQLSSKKLPSRSAVIPSSSSSESSSASSRHGKPAWKESRSKKMIAHKNHLEAEGDDEFLTAKEVKRLLSSVADRVALEGNRRRSSAEEDADESLSADERTFSLRDRENEYLKASSEEDQVNREAERVLEWAKDVARLEGKSQGGEDEDLELGEECSDSGTSSDGDMRNSTSSKKKTKKSKKKWGLF